MSSGYVPARSALFIMRFSAGDIAVRKAEPTRPRARATMYYVFVEKSHTDTRLTSRGCVPGGVITRGVAFRASTLGGRRAVRRRRRRRRRLLLGRTDGAVAARNSNRGIEASEQVDRKRERERGRERRKSLNASQTALYRATPLPRRAGVAAAWQRRGNGVARHERASLDAGGRTE